MAAPAQSFRDLIVWQKAHQMILQIYRQTQSFPSDEKFVLTSQLRRAVVSVAANISEGFSKRGQADKARFLNIAQGSLEECHYYLILATDLGYWKPGTLVECCRELARLLNGCARAILTSGS